MKSRHIQFMLYVMVFVFLFGGLNSYAQEETDVEEPKIAFNFYLFAMDLNEMRDMLKEGLNGKELSRLQGELFEQGCLFKEEESKLIKKGANNINIPMARLQQLPEDLSSKIVVFFYEIVRRDELINQNMTLTHRSFVLTEEDGVEKKIAEKEGEWRIPAKSKRFRVMDFRGAVRFFKASFTYEIELPSVEEKPEKYVLTLNVVE